MAAFPGRGGFGGRASPACPAEPWSVLYCVEFSLWTPCMTVPYVGQMCDLVGPAGNAPSNFGAPSEFPSILPNGADREFELFR